MKSILLALSIMILFPVGSASAQKARPISANGAPLAFQVVGASVTQEAQSSEQVEFFLTPGGLAQAASTGVYSAPLGQNRSYQPLPRTPSESFIVVRFNVTNVKKQLWLSNKDVQLIDGKGSVHQTLGCQGQRKNSWSQFESLGLDPKKDLTSTWIFKVPTDAISGAAIQFPSSTYPIPAMLIQPEAAEMHDAAQNGDLAKVRALLKDNPKLLLSKDIEGSTPLHAAAAVTPSKKEMVEFLLANGADVNAKDASGRTPLRFAVLTGDKEVAELLLANHSDVNTKDNKRMTPLHAAANEGRSDVAEFLLAKGSAIEDKDNDGCTALHLAALSGQSGIVKLLLANKADISARTLNGNTPLHEAVSSGGIGSASSQAAQRQVAELLLASGADVNAKNNRGETPLRVAQNVRQFGRHSEDKAMVALLRQHGGRK